MQINELLIGLQIQQLTTELWIERVKLALCVLLLVGLIIVLTRTIINYIKDR